jgi:hypothetical protein
VKKPLSLTTRPFLPARVVKSCEVALLAAGASIVGCGGAAGPARHPVAEMTARASAKLEVIPLVVSDPKRAERVREVFAELAAVGRDFDRVRARSVTHARDEWARRGAAGAAAPAASAEELELLLAPPVADARAAYARYTTLMLEARSLLSEAEFEKLDRVR